MIRYFVFLFSVFVSCFLTLSAQSGVSKLLDGYRLTLVDDRWPAKPFVVDINSTNKDGVEQLLSYIENGVVEDKNGNPEIGIVFGNVELTEPTPEHPWKFNINPNSVQFSDLLIELCDGNFEFVEDNLPYWQEKVKIYCPWTTARKTQKIEKVEHGAAHVIWARKSSL